MTFFSSDRQMLDALWNDRKLAFIKLNLLIAQLNQEMSLDHQKQFVFSFVLMPDELAFELH